MTRPKRSLKRGEKINRGVFVVFEGGEGCGKSTQVRMLADWLERHGFLYVQTREPGDPLKTICVSIRQMLLNPKNAGLFERTELFLFLADRAEHVATIVRPELESGKIVVGDRFHLATFAYQCGGRGIPFPAVSAMNSFATGGLLPDITFLLDIDPKLGLQRKSAQADLDRFEAEKLAFHRRVRSGFLQYAETSTKMLKVIDASQTLEEIHGIVIETMRQLLPWPKGGKG